MASLLSEKSDITMSTESSPRKLLRHAGYNNTMALLGWIGFHADTVVPVTDLGQLAEGTVLLRLMDVLTQHSESDRLRPVCISADGPIPSSLYVPSVPSSAALSSSAASSSHSSAPASPEKRRRVKVVGGGADGREMSRFQKLANIEVFMHWLNTSKASPFHGVSRSTDEITIRGVAALDILEADGKLVPGLLWSLFWEFVLCPSRISKNKQELLWMWTVNTIASFERKSPKEVESSVNFKPETWSDSGGLTRRLAVSLQILPPDSTASVAEVLEVVHKTHKVPPFLTPDDLNGGIVDEWSIIAYFSCWFDVFNLAEEAEAADDRTETAEGEDKTAKISETIKEAATPKSKGEFSEFFGPNILNKASAIAQHDYDMPLKLRIETFLVLSARIIHVKNNFLARLEKLLLEIANLLGQFAEYESYDYQQSPSSSIFKFSTNHYKPEDLKFKGKDLFELEKQITNTTEENDELSETLQQAIKSISFVTSFRNSTRQKIYEQFIELEMYKCQLSDMLRIYGLQHFSEPPEKSLDKISKFIELLKKSEMVVHSNADDYIERNITKMEKSFYENHSSLFNALSLVENDIVNANTIPDFDQRTKELENIMQDIPGLKELHLRTVSFWHELEMVYSSLARGFDKQSYKSIINEQRYKIIFLENCIDKSMNFMISLETQKNEASEVLTIANIAQQYENSKELRAISEDRRQLKTHLLVHKLIQRRFHFNKNIDPIQVLFDRHDTGSKGYLTKSEFKKAFLVAYPGTATLVGVDEVDTIFETSYETVGKMRRGIEFPQFKAVLELGNNSKGSEEANVDVFAAALSEDDCGDAKETTSISSTNSNIDRLLHQIESEKHSVDLTDDVFYHSFVELSSNQDVLQPHDMDTIHLHPMLRVNVENIFPDHNYREWFQHVDQSSIYQDNEDCETIEANFGGHPREIALKNVLYDLEKVDLSKI